MGYMKTNKQSKAKENRKNDGGTSQAARDSGRREDGVEAENRQEATVTIWMRPDGGLEREVVEEFESGSLQAF